MLTGGNTLVTAPVRQGSQLRKSRKTKRRLKDSRLDFNESAERQTEAGERHYPPGSEAHKQENAANFARLATQCRFWCVAIDVLCRRPFRAMIGE